MGKDIARVQITAHALPGFCSTQNCLQYCVQFDDDAGWELIIRGPLAVHVPVYVSCNRLAGSLAMFGRGGEGGPQVWYFKVVVESSVVCTGILKAPHFILRTS